MPISPVARAAVDRVVRERPGIGPVPLFPCPTDPMRPIGRHLADAWLREAERIAEVETQSGSLWHAYRRKWATERKLHLLLAVLAQEASPTTTVFAGHGVTQQSATASLHAILAPPSPA